MSSVGPSQSPAFQRPVVSTAFGGTNQEMRLELVDGLLQHWKELLNGEAGRLWVRQVVDPADLEASGVQHLALLWIQLSPKARTHHQYSLLSTVVERAFYR